MKKKNNNGFTIIETLVSLVIISVGILGFALLQVESLRATQNASQRSKAIHFSNDMMDRVRVNPKRMPNINLTCNYTEMAAYEVWQWRTMIANPTSGFNGGTAGIDVQPLDPLDEDSANVVTITIQWGEREGPKNFVLSSIEDIRLANYWGLHSEIRAVSNGSNNPTNYTIGPIKDDCPTNWALNLTSSIGGSNEVYPPWAGPACLSSGDHLSNTDTIVLRHADFTPVPTANLIDGQVYVRSVEPDTSLLFVGKNEPIISDAARNYPVLTHGYYVRPYTFEVGDNLPSLRRLSLQNIASTPTVADDEITVGVEDLQIQFGIDTDATDGVGYDTVDLYVHPSNPILNTPRARILSVRIWLRMRSVRPEQGYENPNIYTYANVANYQPKDNFRRLVISKTIQVRNSTNN